MLNIYIYKHMPLCICVVAHCRKHHWQQLMMLRLQHVKGMRINIPPFFWRLLLKPKGETTKPRARSNKAHHSHPWGTPHGELPVPRLSRLRKTNPLGAFRRSSCVFASDFGKFLTRSERYEANVERICWWLVVTALSGVSTLCFFVGGGGAVQLFVFYMCGWFFEGQAWYCHFVGGVYLFFFFLLVVSWGATLVLS